MASGRKGTRSPAFEQALARLEVIVRELEDGDRPLEESLKLFEEGVALTRLCAARLDEAQRRIEVLTRGEGGTLRTAPFEEEAADAEDEEGPDRA